MLAHSDIAPLRKDDPGELFPWKQLHDAGIGHWVEPAPVTEGAVLKPGDRGAGVAALRAKLRRYGYGIDEGEDYEELTAAVVRAFQRHFRPAKVDGVADASTITTLGRLDGAG